MPDAVAEPRSASAPVGGAAVDELARRLATEAPELADLQPDQLEAVARMVLGQRLARDLDHKVDVAGIDYEAEKATFLETAGKSRSKHTKAAYGFAVGRLEAFSERRGIAVLAMMAKDADDFAYSLSAAGRAPASVRLDLAACSSFFTFLERRAAAIRNPFRGTKARPAKNAVRAFAFPDAEELERILEALNPLVCAAAVIMAKRGLRAGALPSLTIRAGRFTAQSKGKDISGTLPVEAFEAIQAAGLDDRAPFVGTSATKLEDAIRKTCLKLAAEGKIKAAYSAHDLRHFYAVREYRKDRDLHRVSKLLGHASIQVTESYLKGLGEVD
jgi:site-specific recombinase XerD